MKVVRLNKEHLKKVQPLYHPIFKDCRKYTEEELQPLVARRLAGASPEELIMALRSATRFLVAAYLTHWPRTRRFKLDMVSEAMLAVTKLVTNLEETESILNLTSKRVRDRIEKFVNVDTVVTPSLTVQKSKGYVPPKVIELGCMRKTEPSSFVTREDMHLFDGLDSLERLHSDSELDLALLEPDNWGLSCKELSTKLGVHAKKIERRRKELFKKYARINE